MGIGKHHGEQTRFIRRVRERGARTRPEQSISGFTRTSAGIRNASMNLSIHGRSRPNYGTKGYAIRVDGTCMLGAVINPLTRMVFDPFTRTVSSTASIPLE